MFSLLHEQLCQKIQKIMYDFKRIHDFLIKKGERYIPPLMLADFPIERTRFIMGSVTLLQIIYMTEVGLIIIKSRIPVNVGHLFVVFLERTILAIPLVTLLTNLLVTF